MFAELREPLPDEPHDGGTGGADHGAGDIGLAHVAASTLGNDLRGPRHLVDLVEAELQQGFQQAADIRQVVELPVESGSRQNDPVLVLGIDVGELVKDGSLRLVLADPHAAAAVDAEVGADHGVAVADADGLRGTVAETGGAADTLFGVQ